MPVFHGEHKASVKNFQPASPGVPKRLTAELCDLGGVFGWLVDRSDLYLRKLGRMVNDWQLMPNGTEGYRTAEVTLGGIDTNELSSQTMDAKAVPGLYFIGEVVDVTGHLGEYNFQWALSSGFVAGQYVRHNPKKALGQTTLYIIEKRSKKACRGRKYTVVRQKVRKGFCGEKGL